MDLLPQSRSLPFNAKKVRLRQKAIPYISDVALLLLAAKHNVAPDELFKCSEDGKTASVKFWRTSGETGLRIENQLKQSDAVL